MVSANRANSFQARRTGAFLIRVEDRTFSIGVLSGSSWAENVG